MILICYDGSADAQAAIAGAAELMPGREATVLVVWETLMETMTRNGAFGGGLGMIGVGDEAGADAAIEKSSLESATEGAQRATAAGLIAQPRIARRHSDMVAAILATADDLDAELIVLGTRGLGGLKSMVLGSVSRGVLHHADRPVLVVPSPPLIEQRRDWAERTQSAFGVA